MSGISSVFSFKHISHSPHGTLSRGFKQLTSLANIFAIVVLPVPLVPQKDKHDQSYYF